MSRVFKDLAYLCGVVLVSVEEAIKAKEDFENNS